ncbi:DYSF [Branchiostoma lanceolatum]|uniref:DYSF protein n=1 Tax=Branchiostoma lanceolatum TaxID=7740 RepID=A0A8J9Z095_BRALA|nr:DYSF [Branchiostoma lanceolatum]
MALVCSHVSADLGPSIDDNEEHRLYVGLQFRGETFKTSSLDVKVKDGSSPHPARWNKQNMTWNLVELGLNIEADQLSVVLKEKIRVFKDRVIGRANISLKEVFTNPSNKTGLSCHLHDETGRALQSKVTLKMMYIPPGDVEESTPPTAPSESESESEEDEDDANEEKEERRDDQSDHWGGMEAANYDVENSAGVVKGSAIILGNKPLLNKEEELSDAVQDFQVRVRLVEGRSLYGENVSPVCKITLAGRTRQSRVCRHQHDPNFNESFFFNFHESPANLLQECLSFTVFDSRRWRKDALIGSFKIDLLTIYQQPDHALLSKWMLLTDPDDVAASSRGFLKASLVVLGHGDSAPVEKPDDKLMEKENIEENLLRPAVTKMVPANLCVRIYHAKDLPETDRGSLLSNRNSLPDGYVIVNFSGKKVETKLMKDKENPHWNQELRIDYKFPTLSKEVKIEIYDEDRMRFDDLIATTFLRSQEISFPGQKGFLPSFGPCYLNLYGPPLDGRTSVSSSMEDEMEKGKKEGVAYRGRLMVELKTELSQSKSKPGVSDIKRKALDRMKDLRATRNYRVFVALLEATLIDRGGDVKFEVSMGHYGNNEPGWEKFAIFSSTSSIKLMPSEGEEDNLYHVPWDGMCPVLTLSCAWEDIVHRIQTHNALINLHRTLNDKVEELKAACENEDNRGNFAASAKQCLTAITNECTLANQMLVECGDEGQGSCKVFNNLDRKLKTYRLHQLSRLLYDAKRVADILDNTQAECDLRGLDLQVSFMPQSDDIDEASDEAGGNKRTTKQRTSYDMAGLLKTIMDLSNDPQLSLPDIFLWLVINDKRVAYRRIKPAEVFYSSDERARGDLCGSVHYVNLKDPDYKKTRDGRSPCLLRMKAWFSDDRDDTEFLHQLDGEKLSMWMKYDNDAQRIFSNTLPRGLTVEEEETEEEATSAGPLNQIVTEQGDTCGLSVLHVMENTGNVDMNPLPGLYLQTEGHEYELHCYIYQARDLQSADRDGMDDPFLSVFFSYRNQRTNVVKKTLNPVWNQTLVFQDLRIYGTPEAVAANPPPVVIQVYDHDLWRNEHLGFVEMTPLVAKDNEQQGDTRLRWHQISVGGKHHGDVLATCKLFRVGQGAKPPVLYPTKADKDLEQVYTIPESIRPKMRRMAIDVVSWGVRNMKRCHLLVVNSPSVEFAIAGKVVLRSSVIANAKDNPNFSHPLLHTEMELPVDPDYMPPMTIKVYDNRLFGFKPLAGVHVINTLSVYEMQPSLPEHFIDCDQVQTSDRLSELQTRLKKTGSHLPPVLETDVDWWSLFYTSIGDIEKGDPSLQHDLLEVYDCELEKVPAFQGLTDFVQLYPLERGRESYEDDGGTAGQFKGSIKLCPVIGKNKDRRATEPHLPEMPVECVVRVYVVRAMGLQPHDTSGLADPYLSITCGDYTVDDIENYIPNTLEPIFGRMYEFTTRLPQDKDLHIAVYDKDVLSADDLIGQTTIDLEDRYLSRHRATCGLPRRYHRKTINCWRDSQQPEEILKQYSVRHGLPLPRFKGDSDLALEFGGKIHRLTNADNVSDKEEVGLRRHKLALKVLRSLCLVPEHVETRALYSPLQPGLEQGKLQMWVDIFPKTCGPPGPEVDISPRVPQDYELRVAVLNTSDVVLDETSFVTGEMMSDIYVKGNLAGLEEDVQSTDVHYRSMNGEGTFNWRFVFPFNFIAAERVMSITKKAHLWSIDKTERREYPKLLIQLWDNDKFSPDDYLGMLTLNLVNMAQPAAMAKDCKAAVKDGKGANNVSLFHVRRLKGWWPCQRMKQDGSSEVTGKVQLELEVLPATQAKQRPVGRGREEPNANPVLEPPMTLKFIVWKYHKWTIIRLLLLVVGILMMIPLIETFPIILISWIKIFLEMLFF